jgi:hypothetical protein
MGEIPSSPSPQPAPPQAASAQVPVAKHTFVWASLSLIIYAVWVLPNLIAVISGQGDQMRNLGRLAGTAVGPFFSFGVFAVIARLANHRWPLNRWRLFFFAVLFAILLPSLGKH